MRSRGYILIAFVTVSTRVLSGQSFTYMHSFGNFESASDFAVSPQGFIYVSDTGTDEVSKYSAEGELLKTIGGYGWSEDQFDDPVDINVSTLSLFICDYNNDAVKQFDKDLNYIFTLNTGNATNEKKRFAYPISCAASSMGDLFVLDGDNYRIIKYDFFGNYQFDFAGFDQGIFSLNDPYSMTVSGNSYVIAADREFLLIYDTFGHGIKRIELPETITNINGSGEMTLLTGENSIYRLLTSNNNFRLELIDWKTHEEIIPVSAFVYSGSLFVLSETEVSVFKKAEEK